MHLRLKHQLNIQMMHGVPNKHAAGEGILDYQEIFHQTAICFPVIDIQLLNVSNWCSNENPKIAE